MPLRLTWPGLATLAVLAAAAWQLHAQGRLWVCACGYVLFWAGDTQSADNSQHFFDPYTFTHVLHGVVLAGLLWLVARRLPPVWQLWLALTLESLWEVLENSAAVIDRYRTATMALGYTGDTVLNSLGDIVACGIGFGLARRLGLWRSLALFVVLEALLILWIRDSLLLNIIMLTYPLDAIKAWQSGG